MPAREEPVTVQAYVRRSQSKSATSQLLGAFSYMDAISMDDLKAPSLRGEDYPKGLRLCDSEHASRREA